VGRVGVSDRAFQQLGVMFGVGLLAAGVVLLWWPGLLVLGLIVLVAAVFLEVGES
jgi:hypothetical protein